MNETLTAREASNFVNPYAKKDWEAWAHAWGGDGYTRDTKGKIMKPNPAQNHPMFLHTYPKFVQDGYWQGRNSYYSIRNNDYTFHYPVHDCPKCKAKQPWKKPFTSVRRIGEKCYWDKELQKNIPTHYRWCCAECDRRTVFDTRTGERKRLFGLF